MCRCDQHECEFGISRLRESATTRLTRFFPHLLTLRLVVTRFATSSSPLNDVNRPVKFNRPAHSRRLARSHPLYGGVRTDEDVVDCRLPGVQSSHLLLVDVSSRAADTTQTLPGPRFADFDAAPTSSQLGRIPHGYPLPLGILRTRRRDPLDLRHVFRDGLSIPLDLASPLDRPLAQSSCQGGFYPPWHRVESPGRAFGQAGSCGSHEVDVVEDVEYRRVVPLLWSIRFGREYRQCVSVERGKVVHYTS